MFNRLTYHRFALASALALGLAGCATDEAPILDDTFNNADEIASALELENGGLDMVDEAPMFDDVALFEASELSRDDVPYRDVISDRREVRDMIENPAAILYHTTMMWGQIPGSREVDTPYNWSGQISVNRGAIIVRSVLAFDGRVDGLADRTDARVVSFRSATRPSHDGLRFVVVDPTPEADEALTLTYTQVDGFTLTVAMADIVGEPQSFDVDDAGNQIVLVAMTRPVDVCEHGFMHGRWHRVDDGHGRILGRVADAEGNPLGHMRGVYGRRRSGEQVFFAKFIAREGGFRGILHGTYGEGHFTGRWLTRDGDRGQAGGQYRETSLRDDRVAGRFIGRFAETRCNLDVSR